MGMTDLQLDIFAEMIYEKQAMLEKDMESTDSSTYRYALLKGTRDGLIQALTYLGIIEEGKHCRAKISALEEKCRSYNKYGGNGNCITKTPTQRPAQKRQAPE